MTICMTNCCRHLPRNIANNNHDVCDILNDDINVPQTVINVNTLMK